MELQDFLEINKAIFRRHSKPVTIFNVSAGIVTVAGGVYAYFHGVNSCIHAATHWLNVDAKTQDALELQISGHLASGLRLLAPVAFVVLVYLIVFAYHAGLLSAKYRRSVVTAREEWAQEKHELLRSSDYIDKLGKSVGVAPWSVRYVYEILNYEGDCKLFQDEEFKLAGLKLYHMRRQHSSTCGKKRSAPIIDVKGAPPEIRPDKSYEDVGNERIFHFRFTPALENTQTPIGIHISEEVEKNFVMTSENFPDQWPFDTGLEYVKYGVSQPTQSLEMRVIFPIGYTVREKMLFRIRYGNSETDHQQEQERIQREKGLTQDRDDQGRNCITLRVEKPIVGLSYIICWNPPDAAGYETLRAKYVVGQTPKNASEAAANAVANPHVQPSS